MTRILPICSLLLSFALVAAVAAPPAVAQQPTTAPSSTILTGTLQLIDKNGRPVTFTPSDGPVLIIDSDGHPATGSVSRSGTGMLILSQDRVKATYLGTCVSPADPALRAQLKLPDGVGLVVNSIDEQSPAKAADLRQHDLLYKLNDQLLIDPHQLSVLVRTLKPGEPVRLTVIRQAQTITLTVTPIEKDLPPLTEVPADTELHPLTESTPANFSNVSIYYPASQPASK